MPELSHQPVPLIAWLLSAILHIRGYIGACCKDAVCNLRSSGVLSVVKIISENPHAIMERAVPHNKRLVAVVLLRVKHVIAEIMKYAALKPLNTPGLTVTGAKIIVISKNAAPERYIFQVECETGVRVWFHYHRPKHPVVDVVQSVGVEKQPEYRKIVGVRSGAPNRNIIQLNII